jgi:hypothetical protein
MIGIATRVVSTSVLALALLWGNAGCGGGESTSSGTGGSACASSPYDVCPATVELCLAPLAPTASLRAGACKRALPPVRFSSPPACGPVGAFQVAVNADAIA